MKKSFFCFSLALSTFVFNIAQAENELPTVLENFKNTPFHKTIEKQTIEEAKKHILKNKTEFLNKMHQIQNYTEEEYNTLYNNFEVNQPFIIENNTLILNPDYLSKNTPYTEKDGILVKNSDYKKTSFQPQTLTQEKQSEKSKRLGKKSFNINPDFFYE